MGDEPVYEPSAGRESPLAAERVVAPAAPLPRPVVSVLALQRSAGNAAVAALLSGGGAVPAGSAAASVIGPAASDVRSVQRQPAPAPAPTTAAPVAAAPTPLTADELTTRIARCIGIWETNRGGNDPAPKESDLDTVAGVHASMATIEQATTPYAITALKRHKSLRDKATPPLTKKELNAADARCTAVTTLLSSVSAAAAGGTVADATSRRTRPRSRRPGWPTPTCGRCSTRSR